MLPLLKNDRKSSKCFTTHALLPPFVDEKQLPSRKEPFSSLLNLKWCHTLDLILPAEILDVVLRELEDKTMGEDTKAGDVRYAKVMMSLGQLLEGDFFTEYVKKGSVLMLSEPLDGRGGGGGCEFRDGTLRIEVDKPTYERLGLAGKPIHDGGLKHKKNRYVIEMNLRLPSMLHGKKGFDRILWAFKTALSQSLTWFFYDCAPAPKVEGASPIDKHHPLWITSQARCHRLDGVHIPDVTSAAIRESMNEMHNDDSYLSELEEWISLVALGSPRVQARDTIDTFLCRYSIPSWIAEDDVGQDPVVSDMATLRWHGFVPATFVAVAMLRAFAAARRSYTWAAIQAHGFTADNVSVMKLTTGKSAEGEVHPVFELLQARITLAESKFSAA